MFNNTPIVSRFCIVSALFAIMGCSDNKVNYNDADTVIDSAKQQVNLPAPFASRSVRNYCKVIGWPQGKTPTAPAGFKVIG
jgi:hypothetical protein